LGLALEEPQKEDVRFEVDGLTFAVPPDVKMLLEVYHDSVLDHDPHRRVPGTFFVRLGGRSWRCC